MLMYYISLIIQYSLFFILTMCMSKLLGLCCIDIGFNSLNVRSTKLLFNFLFSVLIKGLLIAIYLPLRSTKHVNYHTCRKYLSRVVRKPTFCICENKDADQLRGYREADQRLCFCYIDRTIPLLSKSEISSL